MIAENNYTISSVSLDELAKIQNFAAMLLLKHNISLDINKIIHLIIDELFINIFSYGRTNVSDLLKLDINIAINDNEIKMLFIDNGVEFNPLDFNSDIQINLPINERRTGGLGIYLVKYFADNIEYKYNDNKNHLLFVKYLYK